MRDCCQIDRFLVVAYPNRGDCWDDHHHYYIDPSHDVEQQFTELVARWYDAGARVIGGCCKTNPNLLRVMSEALEFHLDVINYER